MIEWFNGLSQFEQIYWYVAAPASLTFLIVMVSTFVGADAEDDVAGDGVDGEVGFQFFTFKNMVGFLLIFSWTGIGFHRMGYSHGTTVILSVICGLIMMFAMTGIFYLLNRLVEDGTMKMSNAVGKIGEVYLPIKADNGGFGKVQMTIQGAVHELQAMTHDKEDLAVGTVVRVEEIINDHILVVTRKIS